MSRHDEPNEYGYAGDPSFPEPERPHRPDEEEAAEEIAVPGTDVGEELGAALEATEPEAPERPGETGTGSQRR